MSNSLTTKTFADLMISHSEALSLPWQNLEHLMAERLQEFYRQSEQFLAAYLQRTKLRPDQVIAEYLWETPGWRENPKVTLRVRPHLPPYPTKPKIEGPREAGSSHWAVTLRLGPGLGSAWTQRCYTWEDALAWALDRALHERMSEAFLRGEDPELPAWQQRSARVRNQ